MIFFNLFKKKLDVNDGRVKYIIRSFLKEEFQRLDVGVHEIKVKTTNFVEISVKLTHPGLFIGKKGCYPDDLRPRKAIEAAENYLKDPSEENKKIADSAAAL